jgi:hypothetical protein
VSWRLASTAVERFAEYNWTSRIRALLGVRVIEIGRNTTATLTPAIALNTVFLTRARRLSHS